VISNDVWTILGILAIVLLVFFSKGRNAVWGGLILGILLGFAVVFFLVLKGDGFNWYFLARGATIGTLAGLASELIGIPSDFLRKK